MKSLSSTVYERIKHDIVRCRLVPGSFVTEAELAERYDVSKSPIKWALGVLQTENLVTIIPRRGIHIPPISVEDVKHTYLIRSLVEPMTARLAAARADATSIDRMRRLLSDSSGEEKHELRPAQLCAHTGFHVAIAQAGGVPRLTRIIENIHQGVERFLNSLPSFGERVQFGSMDGELLDIISAGNPDKAERFASEIIAQSSRQFLRSLADTEVSLALGLAVPVFDKPDLDLPSSLRAQVGDPTVRSVDGQHHDYQLGEPQ